MGRTSELWWVTEQGFLDHRLKGAEALPVGLGVIRESMACATLDSVDINSAFQGKRDYVTFPSLLVESLNL